jgi:hypothetical protein
MAELNRHHLRYFRAIAHEQGLGSHCLEDRIFECPFSAVFLADGTPNTALDASELVFTGGARLLSFDSTAESRPSYCSGPLKF